MSEEEKNEVNSESDIITNSNLNRNQDNKKENGVFIKHKSLGLIIGLIIILIIIFIAFFTNGNSNVVIKNTGNDVKVISVDSLNSNFISVDNNFISEVDEAELNALPNEIVSKRSYNSRTFKNPDGSYTAQISRGNIFFYDGLNYIDLNRISKPVITKKEINLTETPESNLIDFGAYQLHRGISASIENENLILKDANKKILFALPRPYSIDASGKKSLDEYKLNMNGNNLTIFVEVDKEWLKSARYPVMVDPTVQLDNVTAGVYDGHISFLLGSYARQLNDPNGYYIIGRVFAAPSEYRGFINFNTSSISSNSLINQIILNISLQSVIGAVYTVNITRFNNTRINDNSSYPTNNSGNQKLFNDIGNGSTIGGGYYLTGLTDFQTTGSKTFNLSAGGKNATGDLQNQLGSNGYFGVGFVENLDASTGSSSIYNSEIYDTDLRENIIYTKLIVTYTQPSSCTYSGSGDWTINETCNIQTPNIISGNLIIQDAGFFNLTQAGAVAVNISFSGANRYIYIYQGGQIIINRASNSPGFNK